MDKASEVLAGYRVVKSGKFIHLMPREYNVAVATFNAGTAVDAEQIGAALDILHRQTSTATPPGPTPAT